MVVRYVQIVCASGYECLKACHVLAATQTTSMTSTPPSEITLRALGRVEVTCSVCAKRGHLRNHKAHVDSMCGTTHFQSAPLNPLDDLLSIPEDVTLTREGEIHPSMHNSHTLKVKTGGQVKTIIIITPL